MAFYQTFLYLMIISVKNDSHPRFNTSYLKRVGRESCFSFQMSTSAFWLPSPPSMSFFLGLVHVYPVISENWDFFSYKKSTRIRFVFARKHENAKTIDSIPYRACALWCMVSLYTKTWLFVRRHEKDKPASYGRGAKSQGERKFRL